MILEDADFLASRNIVDLGRSVATSGNVLSIVAEPDAANNTIMDEGVHEVDVENPLNLRIEDSVPVTSSLLVVRRDIVEFKIAKRVADGGRGRSWATNTGVIRRGVADLRRLTTTGVGDRRVDLGGGRSDCVRGPSYAAAGVWAGRLSALWRLTHAVGDRTLGILLVRSCLLRWLLLSTRVRRGRKPRRPLTNLMLRSQLLFVRRAVLLGLLLLRRCETALVATSHDATKESVARRDGRRLLGRTTMRRGARERLALATGGLGELVSEHAQFLFVPGDVVNYRPTL